MSMGGWSAGVEPSIRSGTCAQRPLISCAQVPLVMRRELSVDIRGPIPPLITEICKQKGGYKPAYPKILPLASYPDSRTCIMKGGISPKGGV